jgi:peptidoglycan/xylan/chitin deacetylase (PgdA/CDA1 family)
MVISRFARAGIPLTLGFITANLNTGDTLLAEYLRNITKDTSLTEVACHGWRHEDFGALGLADQVGLLQKW